MDRRRPTTLNPARTLAPLLALLAGALVVGGCASDPIVHRQGQTGIRSTYDRPVLIAELPATVPARSALVAVEKSLERRGHTITASEGTDHGGRVVARPPGRRLHRKLVARAAPTMLGTKLTIEVYPAGDEMLSRAVLDDVLTLMGL